MIACSCKCLSSPVKVLILITGMSIVALGAALASQYIGGLEPCILCIYQRIPFAIAIGLGITGLLLECRKIPPSISSPPAGGEDKGGGAASFLIALCALAFLVNAGIAVYHTGVELKWWESAVEGCKVPLAEENESAESWIDRITSMPAVPCTSIQWKDPLLGLTMANYNAALNLLLLLICLSGLRGARYELQEKKNIS
jgi:disulfide bond formation protein DsbB